VQGSRAADQMNQAENHDGGCGNGEVPAENGACAKGVLILGGGFGGIYAAIELERALRSRSDVSITLVTRDNYFLFTPMLQEVAASDLEMNTIVNPLRKMLRRVKTFTGDIDRINLERRCVVVTHGFDRHTHELAYDHLIIALGSSTNFFGLPGVQEIALTIKTLDDAVELRNRLITHLEEANSECAAGQRQPLLTFVVVGAGFAGVETLGGINDFVREAIRFYPNLTPELVRTILISSEEFILPELGSKLGAYAQRKLAARDVEIITRARVTGARNDVVELSDGRKITTTTLIWAAGNAPSPLVAALPIPKSGGRIVVDEYLEVKEFPGVWALGDCASIPDLKTGGFYPPTAQHAIREARCAARNIAATILKRGRKPFRFSALGRLAAIGRRTGVANVFGFNFSGFLAWWLWRTIYLFKLPRLEKKMRVALDWTLDLCFAKDFACVTARRPLRMAPSEGSAGKEASRAA
jgi:NADH:ubiquinone reductase (H+-translocating)